MPSRVAVTKWQEKDDIASAIIDELHQLGYPSEGFLFNNNLPPNTDILLSFAPHQRLGAVIDRLSTIPVENRPAFIHWNYESLPNIRIPWTVLSPMIKSRVWFDRCLNDREVGEIDNLVLNSLIKVNRRAVKFRHLGEYQNAYEGGFLHLLIDISSIYSEFYKNLNIKSEYIPFGTSPNWYSDLNLERDIDVLWMGLRRTRRRSKLLDKLRDQLRYYGIEILVIDNVENPFMFGEKRIHFLNRAKITLNILPTWYDPAFIVRFHLAAGNRSLVVSEPILPHCPAHVAGEHYIQVKISELAKTIYYYVNNEKDRLRITDNAYQLVTNQMSLQNSIRQIMESAKAFTNLST